MVMFKMEQSENLAIEDGEYDAELADVQDTDGKFGPCVRFIFSIIGGAFDGASASVLTSQKLQPGNKLDQILRALGAEPLEIGETLDGEALKGRQAKIYVESKQQGEKTYNNITKIKPAKVGGAKPAVAATPATAAVAHAPVASPTTVPVEAPSAVAGKGTGVKEPVSKPAGNLGINVVEEIEF